ncbi:MAG: DUF393 domain-containing protein [Saprospiraceae bacterium]|nr:MAG: thiol-disulfide oxidoreductase [Bacteroidetes bacterium OLB9]MCO6464109.1 DUF393 domain-containing protein [Saprospiraceae bacterium]MCZ2339129.1 DUF393 domain-containing protein [Chitinophagales bacterium]
MEAFSKDLQIKATTPIVIFDIECLLCNKAIKWLLQRDKAEKLMMISFDAAEQQFNLPLNRNSIILLYDNNTYYQSDAVLKIGQILGGKYYYLSKICSRLPRILRDGIYNLIARYRYKIFGKVTACEIPDESLMHRLKIQSARIE